MSVSKNIKKIDNKYIILKKLFEDGLKKSYLAEKINDNYNIKYEVIVSNQELGYNFEKKNKLFNNEIEVLKKLSTERKKHITYLVDYGKGFITKDSENNNDKKSVPYYVIDYYPKKSLFYYLTKKEDGFEENLAKIVFKKILEGIKRIHEENICLLDINVDNILLKENYEPVITNFCFAAKIHYQDGNIIKIKKKNKIYPYSPPEMFGKEYAGDKVDIFYLGIILFNLVTNRNGFTSTKPSDKLYNLIKEQNYDLYWDSIHAEFNKLNKPFTLSEEFKDLYIKMIAYKPEYRPSIDEILNAPWMKNANNFYDSELFHELIMLDDKLKSDNEILESSLDTKCVDYNSRNRSFYDDAKQYFDYEMAPKKIKINDLCANNYVIIKGYMRAVEFMNSLIGVISKKDKNCYIEVSKKKLKFQLIFENETNENSVEDNEENDEDEIELEECVILIKLYEDEKGNHVISFTKKEGELKEYYKKYLLIKDIIRGLVT